MHAFEEAKVLNAMSGAEFLLKGPLPLPPTLGVATARNLDHGTEWNGGLVTWKRRRRRALDTSGIEKIGTLRRRLFQTETIWFVLKFFAC